MTELKARLQGLLGKVRRRLRPEPERSFSLGGMDLKLAEFLPKRGGFFIEAGANDGVTYSNTLFFERYRGWRGLLVEPVAELATRCRKNRPHSIVENCALVDPDFPEPSLKLNVCNLMSFVPGAMGSAEKDEEHLRRGCEVQGITAREETVPARTLASLLEQHGVRQVDFLSLDVEGFELPALRGLDLQRFAPAWILVEVRDRGAMDGLLGGKYEAVTELSHHDVLYRRRAA